MGSKKTRPKKKLTKPEINWHEVVAHHKQEQSLHSLYKPGCGRRYSSLDMARFVESCKLNGLDVTKPVTVVEIYNATGFCERVIRLKLKAGLDAGVMKFTRMPRPDISGIYKTVNVYILSPK